MKGAPLVESGNPELVHRGYNIALKLVPNVVGQMTEEQLVYFEANQSDLKSAAQWFLSFADKHAPRSVEAEESKITAPSLRATPPTLGDWLTAREELHQFFTGENIILRDLFALTDEQLASTMLMPAFRPAGATNRMAVEWKLKMGENRPYEEVDVMKYSGSKGSKKPTLCLINRSTSPDEDTLGENAKSPDQLIAIKDKLWLNLFGWCDVDTLHTAITGKHLDPETWTWFPNDRLPGGGVACGRWGSDRLRVYLGWSYADGCGPGCGVRAAILVPLTT